MKLLILSAGVLVAASLALHASAQRVAGSGTANASVIDAATIGVPPPASALSQFGSLFDVAAALADPATARVVLPRGAGAPGGGAQTAPAITWQRNADGSVSGDVTGSGPAYAVTQSPSGAISVDYN